MLDKILFANNEFKLQSSQYTPKWMDWTRSSLGHTFARHLVPLGFSVVLFVAKWTRIGIYNPGNFMNFSVQFGAFWVAIIRQFNHPDQGLKKPFFLKSPTL